MSVTGTVEAPSASLLMTPVCEWPMHPQCRDTIQRDLDCGEVGLCKTLEVQQGQIQGPTSVLGHLKHGYRLSNEWMESCPEDKGCLIRSLT